MSTKKVLDFLSDAAQDEQLKEQLSAASTQDELVEAGKQAGYDFSAEHVDEAIAELKQRPGFFGALAEALLKIFSPAKDDYPATGVQPFSGDPNPNP